MAVKMKTEKMENALQDVDRKSGVHLLRRIDGSLRLEYDVTEPGLHSIMIMVNGKHICGSPIYCNVQKFGDSYSTVYAADVQSVMDFVVREQNRCNDKNEVDLQSRCVDNYPASMLWHNICTDLSCHYSSWKQSLLTNSSHALENENISLDESFYGEPYSGMRLPVVIPDSSHPALSYAYNDEQKGNTVVSWKPDIKREIITNEEEWYSNMNKESTEFCPDQLTSCDTTEQVEAIDLSVHRCNTDRAEQASENQSDTTPDCAGVESRCQETAETHTPGSCTSEDKPRNGNESNMACSKQQSVRRKLHKRLPQTSDKDVDAGTVNETTNKSVLICPELHCNQQFKTQIRLLVHKQVHEFLKSLGGPFSDGNLSSLVTLEAVKKPDLSTDVLMWYKCPAQSCLKCFKSIASLEKHLVLHCTPLYRCTEPGCTKCFHLKKTLVLHKSEHTQEKHICTKCGKSYRSKKHLQAHMRYHTDNTRKYVCTVPGCNSRFNLNRYLQQHMFTHKTTFDYLCQICGKAFKRSECLRAHLLSKSHKKIEQSL